MTELRRYGLAGVLMVTWAAAGAAAAGADAAAGMAVVRRRVVESLLPPGGPPPPAEGEVRRMLAALQADGRWSDIDYADPSRAAWPAGSHVRRCLALTQAYRTAGHPLAGKAELRDRILSALRWWVTNDPQCPNWWWNRIGVPEALGRTMVLLGDEFPADLSAGASTILRRADSDDMTGQNTFWVCGVRMLRGLVERSPETVAAAFGRIADEIKVTTREGIQPDFSFHQHGDQLYSGGYGRGYSTYGPHFARLAAETPLAMPPEKVELLTRYLLDGQQWVIRGDRFDPSTVGREIVRKGHSAAPLVKACEDMIALGSPRRDEFEAMARRLRGDKTAPPLVGNRHFWRSDYQVHQRPEWYASVRMFSTRTLNTELANGEGKKSHHLADGLTLIMRSGREFDHMPPVWDWKRLPGVTCEQGAFPEKVQVRGKTSFVGGVSDGMYGAAAMDLRRGTLAARKAWFFFDKDLVCLGAGITCTSDARVLTSIDQRPLAGQVLLLRGKSGTPASRGEQTVGAGTAVWHDGLQYRLLAPEAATLRLATQTGSYREISDAGSPEPLRADVFSMWLDHGVRPEGATYAYVVRGGGEQNGRGTDDAVPIVPCNSADLQAAWSPRPAILAAIFWKAGRLKVPGGPTVAVDQPCAILLRETPAGATLAVANPDAAAIAVTVDIDRRLQGQGCEWSADRSVTVVRFDLPGGAEGGRTLVRELSGRL